MVEMSCNVRTLRYSELSEMARFSPVGSIGLLNFSQLETSLRQSFPCFSYPVDWLIIPQTLKHR